MATRPTKTAGATGKPPATENPKKTLRVTDQEGRTRARILAELTVSPIFLNVSTVLCFAKGTCGELDLTEAVGVMKEKVANVQAGNLAELEATLTAQAVALNAIFSEMARRASANMGEYLNATETYLRPGLKAQAQCRATLQTLAEIKNPHPVAFVKQANIANGPQQVNKGTSPGHRLPARAGNSAGPPNELLGVTHEERLDAGTAGAAGGADRQLETVGTLHRSQD
jgi:hypothetical protein